VRDANSRSASLTEEEDDDEEEKRVGKALASSKYEGKKKGSASAPRGLHKTGAGIVKVRGRVRNNRGRFVRK